MTYVLRNECKTIAKEAGWNLVKATGWNLVPRHRVRGVFAHAATGRVVEISAESSQLSPENCDVFPVLWENLVEQLIEAGLTSGQKSV